MSVPGAPTIGTAVAESIMRLTAANVALLELTGDAERASRMAAGWVYLASWSSRISAAADRSHGDGCGLHCARHPDHRDRLCRGEIGCLCQTPEAFEACMAMLINDAEVHPRIARAGNAEARRRLTPETLEASVRPLSASRCGPRRGWFPHEPQSKTPPPGAAFANSLIVVFVRESLVARAGFEPATFGL